MNSPDKNTPRVSRAGRVRKKSSKLADFLESPDEALSPKTKKQSKKTKLTKVQPSTSDCSSDSESDDTDALSETEMKVGFPIWESAEAANILNSLKHDFDDDADDEEMEGFDNESMDAGQLDDEDTKDSSSFSQAQSLYLSEKKKPIAKEGGTKGQKAKRRDKGKTRLTAYMMWSKTVRSEIVEQNPTWDFSAINKRLGEMWALIPAAQKYKWQNKAKRLAARGEKPPGNSMISTGKSKKYIVSMKNAGNKKQSTTPNSRTLKSEQKTISQAVSKTSFQSPKPSKALQETLDISPPGNFKVSGTSPIDCAAHLKLLGESLNNIGQKLKEHEGQIAVSGSLSVLLDSMLCVLGPLACLINEVPSMESAIPHQTRTEILDNIAYIMPGIV